MDLTREDGTVIELPDVRGEEEDLYQEERERQERYQKEFGDTGGRRVIWMPMYVCRGCGMLNYGKMLKGCTSRDQAEEIMASVLDGSHLGGEYGWIQREKPHKCPSGAVGIQSLKAIDWRWTLK